MVTPHRDAAADQLHRVLFASAAVGLCFLAPDGRLTAVNPALASMLGYSSPEELTADAAGASRLFVARDLEELRRRLREEGAVRLFEAPLSRKDGRVIWVLFSITPADGGHVVTVVDVTDRRQHEQASRSNEARLRSVLINSSENYFILDRDGDIQWVSPKTDNNLGYQPSTLMGRQDHLVHPDDRRLFATAIRKLVSGESQLEVVPHRGLHVDGSWRHLEATVTNMLQDPDVRGLVVNVKDVTDNKSAQARLEYGVFHDDLTDLPNDRFLDRWIHGDQDGDSASEFAVLLVDVDNLNHTNDTFDRRAGDDILRFVAESLRSQLPAEAVLVRWAGDSFAIVICDSIGSDAAVAVAEDIVRSCRHTRRLGATSVFVSVSVGVATGHGERSAVPDLLRDADTALHQAKTRGRNRFELFTGSMQYRLAARLKLEGELRHALEHPDPTSQFRLLLDPLVSFRTGKTVGMEALVAWQHREHGLLRATDFVSLAEETGLISSIGQWVLREACETARRVNRDRQDDPLAMSVNLSAHELNDPEIVPRVEAAIVEADIDPAGLWLEITESALVVLPSARSTLWRLKDMGVRLVVDDFGTGYSSLLSIRELPVDVVKIDKSFVAGLGRRSKDETIVGTVVALARSLELLTVAEGVETARQAEILSGLGCQFGQGYFFGATPPADQLRPALGQPARVGG